MIWLTSILIDSFQMARDTSLKDQKSMTALETIVELPSEIPCEALDV
jgi:hypothetical protein